MDNYNNKFCEHKAHILMFRKLTKLMSQEKTSLVVQDTKHFTNALPKSSCSSAGNVEHVFWKPMTFFIRTTNIQDLRSVLMGLAGTVVDCPGFVRPGSYYHASNTFIYILHNHENFTEAKSLVFNDKEVVRHGRVLVTEPLYTGKDAFSLWRYNVFRSTSVRVAVWDPITGFGSTTNAVVLMDLPMEGFTFNCSSLPFDSSYIAEYDWKSAKANPRKAFANARGTDVSLIREGCRVRNYSKKVTCCRVKNNNFSNWTAKWNFTIPLISLGAR